MNDLKNSLAPRSLVGNWRSKPNYASEVECGSLDFEVTEEACTRI